MWLLILAIVSAVVTIILFSIIEYRNLSAKSTLDYILWIALGIFAIITVVLFVAMIIKYLVLNRNETTSAKRVRISTAYDDQ